jgi:hypothetical protein
LSSAASRNLHQRGSHALDNTRTPETGLSIHKEQHPSCDLTALHPRVRLPSLIQRVSFGHRRRAQGPFVETRAQVPQDGGAPFGIEERGHEPGEAQPLAVKVEPVYEEVGPLGEAGWVKALELAGYAPRSGNKPEALQKVLFSYLEVL